MRTEPNEPEDRRVGRPLSQHRLGKLEKPAPAQDSYEVRSNKKSRPLLDMWIANRTKKGLDTSLDDMKRARVRISKMLEFRAEGAPPPGQAELDHMDAEP